MENVRPTATLERFPMIPAPGKVTLCEVANLVRTLNASEIGPVDFSLYLNFPETYHQIMGSNLKPIVPTKIPSIRVTDSVDNFIVSSHEGWIKGLWSSLLDGGVSEAMRFINQEQNIPSSVRQVVASVVNFWDTLHKGRRKLVVRLYPHYGLDTEDLIEKYSSVRGWKNGWIRALSWHPTFSKLALALNDDSIRIFSNGTDDGFPYLKSPDQVRVSGLAWRPHMDRELAVAAEKGIIVWSLDASLKPTANRARLLTASGHSPVTSVQYSANGRHLLSSSSLDNSIYIWCSNTFEPFALHRYGGGGVPLARWSPSGNQIFSNTPTAAFKVWSANKEWTPNRWKTSGLPVEAMCWAPDGGMIIFASDSYLYTILVLACEEDFVDVENARSAIPVFDLRTIQALQEGTGDTFKVGGKVQQLCISSCGTRLAILFQSSDVVALFRVQKRSPDYLYPLGFVRGFSQEFPVAIEFQKNLDSGSALLTIAWSSTRLQHFPMVDNASLLTNRLQQEEQLNYYRSMAHNRTRDSSSSSAHNSLNISGAGVGAGGDYDNTSSFHQDHDMSAPRFKIFSSP
ncbi:unnamed protein product [Allacma fusca]|uniref:Aladin seven-bladed propeller domain-containing protein n=1 Tax=Allacma fusca TaxID=39272 RepID=A0A8J2LIX9_9HEXA|nr:unnamed protein product [Allacma fusca]